MRNSATSTLFEWLYALATLAFTAGLYIDGWAHNHLTSALETFFTPWHAMFYGGYVLTIIVLAAWTYANRGKIPKGHGYSVAGAAIFAIGGMGDMFWHLVFGIEANIEALLSPTHLLLATGMVLMLTGGLRHYFATRKKINVSFVRSFPMILSVTLLFCLLTFMTQFGVYTEIDATGPHPMNPFYPQAVSVLGITVFVFTFLGCLSLPLRHGRLPFGSITFMLATTVWALSTMRFGAEVLPSALLAGLLGDVLLRFLPERQTRTFRIFSFVVPTFYYLLMMLTLLMTQGVWWSIHMWMGSAFAAGFVGVLMSAVVWPPRELE